ncbi:hypothetical protein LJC13_01020 [Peptostreptococcaceae bacterium OttesenSCG-928-C18]|nr:hypothetical protein [Peptostreptococcaceae bacterium OttesenSCG-928-C18]
MANSILVRKEEEKNQIEAFKKSIRVYFEGDVEYNQKLDFVDYDISEDEDLKRILNVFENRYAIEDLKNLKEDIMFTAFNRENKIIFSYDGIEKFTKSRKKTLENYSNDLKLGYPVDYWIKKCEEINANVTSEFPNALKDSLTDIICSKNGYMVIRIMSGEFDWREEGAMERLNKIIENSKKGTFDL